MTVEMVRKAACDVLPLLSLSDTERKEIEALFSYAARPTEAHYRYLANLRGKKYQDTHSDYYGLLNASSTLLQHIDNVLVWVEGADDDQAETQRLAQACSTLPGPLECSNYLSLKLLHPAVERIREKNTLQEILASISDVQKIVQQQGSRLADLSSTESVREEFKRLEGSLGNLSNKMDRLGKLIGEWKAVQERLGEPALQGEKLAQGKDESGVQALKDIEQRINKIEQKHVEEIQGQLGKLEQRVQVLGQAGEGSDVQALKNIMERITEIEQEHLNQVRIQLGDLEQRVQELKAVAVDPPSRDLEEKIKALKNQVDKINETIDPIAFWWNAVHR